MQALMEASGYNPWVCQDNIMYRYLRRSSQQQVEKLMEELADQLKQIDIGSKPFQITEQLSIVLPNERTNFWLARLLGLLLIVPMVVQVFKPPIWQSSELFRSNWLAFNGDGVSDPKSSTVDLCGEYSGVFLSPFIFSLGASAMAGLFVQHTHCSTIVQNLKCISRSWIVVEPILALGITLGAFTMFKEIVSYIFTKVVI